jgi:hypothetical protein
LNTTVPARPEGKSAWEVALQIAGAATGLAAVAYFVGAVVMWLRLNIAGFPADVGLELVPKARLVAIGVRGIGVVALIAGFLLVLTHFYATRWATPLQTLVASRRWVGLSIAVVIVALSVGSFRMGWPVFGAYISLVLVAAAAVGLVLSRGEGAATWGWGVGIVAALISITASSIHGWRLFGLVVGLLVALALAFSAPGSAYIVGRRVPWWVNVGIVGSVVVAAIAWQVNSPIEMDTVAVSPPPNPDMAGVYAPFFGETDSFIYVAELRSRNDPNALDPFTYTHNILEVPREGLSTVAFGQKGSLRPSIPTPARALWDWLSDIWSKIID